MKINPPTWLDKEERSEYKRLVGMIPGFNSVLDQEALSAYVRTCSTVEELKETLKDGKLTEESRTELETTLRDYETEKMDLAKGLGLTPASRLLIVRAMKEQTKRRPKL